MRRALSRLSLAARQLSAGVLALSLVALGAGAAQAQPTATITVKIEGFKGTEGVALVVLYDSAESWLKIPKAAQVAHAKITGSALTVELKGVKPGSYAVSVIHDENKNNELDMRWLPYPRPKEGSGASGEADNSKAAPKWESSKFEVPAEGKTISVALKYP